MHWPGRTIWDTRIQSISGVLSASDSNGVQIYFSASFAQLTLDPPRVIVNPNRTYEIERIINEGGLFAINVLAANQRLIGVRLMRLPRRHTGKDKVLGLEILENPVGIPFLKDCQKTLFCEVESRIPSGDRQIYVAKVIETRSNPEFQTERPLLFSEVTRGTPRFPQTQKQLRTLASATGALDAIKKFKTRLRPPPVPDIAKTTYEEAGSTEAEINQVVSYGLHDTGRAIQPPDPIQVVNKPLGICVVGTGWGSFHCQTIREANPSVRLFVCGRDSNKTSRLAKSVNAKGYFVDLNEALSDPRIQGYSIALPHHLHRQTVELVAAAGKHALVEKPIATTLEDADAMIDAARKAGTILMVAEDMHFRAAIREVVRGVSLGDIGEPLYLLVNAGGIRKPRGWQANKSLMGGGVMIDIGVHYIRGMRLLMGEPDQVFASRAMQIDTKIEGEDSVQLIFASKLGWQAHMLLSWSTHRGNLPDIVLEGSEGTFHIWPGTRYFDYYPVAPRGLSQALSFVRPHALREKLMSPRLQRVRRSLVDKDPTGYRNEFIEFLDAVANERPPITTPEDGRRDLEIVLAAYEALRTNSLTSIRPLKKER